VHDRVGEALLTGLPDAGTATVPGYGGSAVAAPSVARFERRAMGSPLRLTVVGVPEPRAAAAWAVVSAAFEELEQALSRFRPTSDLVTLNGRAGDPACAPVDRWLYDAVAAAERAWRRTGGAFDPRVLGDLERLGYRGAASPDLAEAAGGAATGRAEVGRGAAFADGRWLHRDPRRRAVAVAAPIDLGGIGKGLALRWGFAILEAALPEIGNGASVAASGAEAVANDARAVHDAADAPPHAGALLEAGGDLVARGAAPQPGPWLVGIESPRTNDEIAVIAVRRGAVCTSSIAVHAWTAADGRAVHHLVDPRTGEPGGDGLVSVTVAGPDPAWAEVWSKALFLEGRERIGPRARALGLAAWWIRDDGLLEMTPAARPRTAWLAGET
jgi:thiamine biosynthesis lipoprotein